MRSTSSASRSRSAMSRSKVSSLESETGSEESSRPRGSMPRARSRSIVPTLPGSSLRSASSSSAASAPTVATPAAGQPLLGARARPRAACARRAAPGTPPRGPGSTTVSATRLAPVAGDLGDDLRGRDAERAGEARGAAHGGLHRAGEHARAAEVVRPPRPDRGSPRPGPVRSTVGHHLADRVPDRARVLGVEAVPWAGRRPPAGSGEAPPRSSSRSGSRTGGRRSSRWRPLRGRAGRRRRRAASSAARAAPAPRPRRRTRPDRGARRSRLER